jgi:hypothetical protein
LQNRTYASPQRFVIVHNQHPAQHPPVPRGATISSRYPENRI